MQELQQIIRAEQPSINAVLEAHVDELPPLARPVARHVLAAGGKRLRPVLTLLWGRMLGCNDRQLYVLGSAVELLHAATLLHDDVLDNASLRRGRAAAHTVFTPTSVILAADAMLAKALLMVSRLGNARMTACIAEAVMHTAEGEIAEFASLRNLDVDYEDYLAIVRGKTAWMLRASCELGALAAEADPGTVDRAAAFGLELGIAFQVVDDALDFSPEEETGKPSFGDLREGKVTPPLLAYVASLPEDRARAFAAAFRENTLDEEALLAAGRAIRDTGCAAAGRNKALPHLDEAGRLLLTMPQGPERAMLLQMTAYIRERSH